MRLLPVVDHRRTSTGNALLSVRSHVACVSTHSENKNKTDSIAQVNAIIPDAELVNFELKMVVLL